MVDLDMGTACGGYTYELEYLSYGPMYTGTFTDEADYMLTSTPSYQAIITDYSWLGTHPFRIKCTNGVPDASPDARGNGGLFLTVYSDPIDVLIIDPCLISVVNGDSAIEKLRLKVPEDYETATLDFAGPTDSASVLYGNGYDICGDLEYTILGARKESWNYMAFTPTVNTDLVDLLSFDVVSDTLGAYLEYKMILKA